MDDILGHIIAKSEAGVGIYEDLFYYVLLIYSTGLRPSSITRLRVGDIIRKTPMEGCDLWPEGSAGFVVRATTYKGGRARTREVVPSPLKAWDWFGYVEGRAASEPLFPHTAPHYGRLFREVLTALGFAQDHQGRPRSIYSLRHTYITRMLRLGVDPLTVAKNTMTSVQMIERHYDRVTPDDLFRRIASFG